MPAIAAIACEASDVGLTATVDTVVATSANLTQSTPYLIWGYGAAAAAATNTESDATLLVGPSGSATVIARAATENGGFTPVAGLGSDSNSHTGALACARIYTPTATNERLEFRAWGESASGAASCKFYAIELTNIPDSGAGRARWSQESTNSDAAVTVPGAAAGDVNLGTALTFTPTQAGDHLILVRAEGFHSGAGAGEYDVALEIDGTVVGRTRAQFDTDTSNRSTHGYLAFDVPNLTLASHTVRVVANGTSAGGNISWRRIEYHAIDVAAFEDSDVQLDTDAAHTQTGVGSSDVGFSVTMNPPASRDFLVIATHQKQVSAWSDFHFRTGGTTNVPTEGFGQAVRSLGLGAANDMPLETGTYVITGVSSSTSLDVRVNRPSFAGNNNYGTDCARAAAAGLALVAIRLYTPDTVTPVTLTPSAEQWSFRDGSSTVALGGLTEAPSAEQWRWQDAAEALALGSVTASPTADRWVWSDGSPTLSLSGVDVPATAERWRFSAANASLVLGSAVLTPTASRWRWSNLAALVSLGALQSAPAADRWRWNVPDRTPSLSGGAAPIVLTPSADAWQWRDGAATGSVGGVSVSPTPDVWRWASSAPSVGITARPSASRWRWQGQTPVVTVGAVSLAPTASQWRWVVPDANLPGFALVGPFGIAVDVVQERTVAVDTVPAFTVKVNTDG